MQFKTWAHGHYAMLILAGTLMLLAPSTVQAQRNAGHARDEPSTYLPTTKQRESEESTGWRRVAEAICWYIPNRIVDFTDIPRFYMTVGDGMGFSARATKYLNATWFQDSAYCLGWSRREPPFFTEQIDERYFGFLLIDEGELDRDPSEIGLSMHFIVVGMNVAASLGEAADFLAGIVGIDLAGDDHGPLLGRDYTAGE